MFCPAFRHCQCAIESDQLIPFPWDSALTLRALQAQGTLRPRQASRPGEPLCGGDRIPGARPPGHASVVRTLIQDTSSCGVDTGRALDHLKGFSLKQSYETQYPITSGRRFRKNTQAVKGRLSFLACFHRGTRWKRLISRTGEEKSHRNAYGAMSSPAFTGCTTLARHSISLGLNHDSFISKQEGRGFALFAPVCLGPRSRPRTKGTLTLWRFGKWVANSPHRGYS